jgi:predicted adenylyl cyclase CyaB
MSDREIERKFLLVAVPAEASGRSLIIQGYLGGDAEGNHARLRDEDGQYTKTVKRGHGSCRLQHEVPISGDRFHNLWPLTEGWRLRKERRRIPYAGLVIEVDRYLDDLSGLITAEVEFTDTAACDRFTPPGWFGTEVTDRTEYENCQLALHGLPLSFSSDMAAMKAEWETDTRISASASEVLRRANAKRSGRFVVLVGGGSGSGKTFYAKRSVKALGGLAMLYDADDYFKGVEFMRAEAAKGNPLNWDEPEAVDYEMLAGHLKELNAGKAVRKPKYEFETGKRIGWELKLPHEVTYVPGLNVLDEPVANFGDFKIFIAAGTHGRVIRRLLRDVVERGQRPNDVLRYFAEVVEPMHQLHVEKTKANADEVIDGDYRPEAEAARSGAYERQIKFRFPATDAIDAAPFFDGMEQIGPTREQQDYYYNPPGHDLSSTGELLRVRQEAGERILAYKGPKAIGSATIDRAKFECGIDGATEKALQILYSGKMKVVTKIRTLYRFKTLILSHDQLLTGRGLQSYLEFRPAGLEDTRILAWLLGVFGLDRADGITKSYFEIV